MDIIGQSLHIWKLLVCGDIAVGVALLALPRVIDIDVHVAGFFHAVASHGISDLAHGSIVNASCEFVPTVPSHRRSFG